MNEQNKHAALTIAQQYPPAQYNLCLLYTSVYFLLPVVQVVSGGGIAAG